MSDFPSLQPAMTVRLNPESEFKIGALSSGGTLHIVPFASGSVITESGFPIQLNADIVFGSDFVTLEASQTHVRINVKAVLKNKADGALISYSYQGVVEIDPEFLAIFVGSPDAKTNDYGKAFTHVSFQTGAEHLKSLEHGVFVGSAHFVVIESSDGGPKRYFVETKVSRVVG